MARPTSRSSDQLLLRLAVGVILVFVLWWAVSFLFGIVMTFIRMALLLLLLLVVGWFVLIGPSGTDE
jgi:hypothetical protein